MRATLPDGLLATALSRRRLLQGIGVAGAAGLLGACGDERARPAANHSATPRRGGTLRVAQVGGSHTTTLDAHSTFYTPNQHLIYNGLVARDTGFAKVNALAARIEPQADARVWQVTLREGLLFHDGTPVLSDDVIFSLQRVVEPGRASLYAGNLSHVRRLQRVDERTLRIELDMPLAWFDDALQIPIVPRHYDPLRPVGTGPFKVEAFVPGEGVLFSRFEGYFDTPALVEALQTIWIPDANARWNALASGQIDIATQINPIQASLVPRMPGLGLYTSPTGSFSMIFMRTDRGVLADVRLRQALRLVIDRQQVLALAYGGFGRVANDLYAPYDVDFRHDLVRSRDVLRARQLVKEAGAEGLKLTLRLTELYGGETALAQVLAENAREIGLQIEVRPLDAASYYASGYHDLEIGIGNWPNNTFFATSAESDAPGASYNVSHFADAEYQALWLSAAQQRDAQQRGTLVGRLQAILFERGGYLIPAYYNTLGAYSERLAGFADDVTGWGLARGLKNIGFIQ